MLKHAIAGLIVALTFAGSSIQPATAGDQPLAEASGIDKPELYQSFRIPLENNKLKLGAVLGTLLDYVGLDGKVLDGLLDTSVDVTGATGRLTMKTVAFATRGIITMNVEGQGAGQSLALRLDRLALRGNRQAVQGRLMRIIEAWEPGIAAKLRGTYGMYLHEKGKKPALLGEGKVPPRVVVLVHGIDEPGWCWDTIAPALVERGHTVVEFRYPNDQSISESAKLLAEHLAKLRAAGAAQTPMIAHSMGALVAREALTNERLYAGERAGGEIHPAVPRLIMLGPPNHGSALAEMQMAGEVREQVVRLFSGDGHLFGAFFDGAGEAKEDLLPGSPFLKALNARPLPKDVKITIVASQVSPVTGKQINAMKTLLGTQAPKDAMWGPDKIALAAASLAEGVGDGAVPVASTKLKDVTDHMMVDGNHSSMLHKTTGDKTAISIILKRLEEK